MSQPFKFRYVNQIVGSFVLLSSLLVIVSVAMIGLSQRWFTSIQIITLKIPSGLSTDLRPGTDVVIGGSVAGSVQSADPDLAEPGATVARLAIPKNFMATIHRDSKVEILRSLGGVGDPFVKISGGSAQPMRPGDSIDMIAANIKPSPTEMAQVAIGDIRDAAVQSMHNIDKAVNSIDHGAQNISQAVADYNDKDGNVQQAFSHANSIIAAIDQGKSLTGKILKDEKFASDVAAMLPKTNETLDTLNASLKDIQKTTAQLPDLATSLNKDVDQVPAMVADLRATIARVNLLLADLQKTTASLPQTTVALNQTMQTLPGLVLQTQETLRQMQRVMEAAQKSLLLRGLVGDEPQAGAKVNGDKVAP